MVHHHSIRFKMDNKKHIVNLESFREMLHICPRLPGQTFDDPSFEEEILAFLRSLGHSREIKRLTDEGSDDEQASDEEDEEFIHASLSTHNEEETRDEESFDPIPKTPENTDNEGNGEENLGTNIRREEGQDEEDEEDELYRDVNINLGRGVQIGDGHTTQEFKDSHVTLTPCDGAVVGTVVMVEGVRVGADTGRGATEVGVCTSIWEVV
nr:hypothetical protein [Tanacetum cinerariifolium]